MVETAQIKKSACILCSINCGLDITVGGKDGRELLKIKGDKDNVGSQGYLCNKAARLNHYQMGADRLDTPLKRMPDGSHAPIDWDTAIREIAERTKAIQSKYGGDKIYFVGGGGQGNHLGGVYFNALMSAVGAKYATNALAQEKTGEFWVQGKMFGGGGPHGDFHHAEVAVFLGKNPWQAHGFPQTRKILREIANDPARSMVVFDPALTDTAKMADHHVRVRPGTDAWCLSAMIAVIIQEGLENTDFIASRTDGFDTIRDHFAGISVSEYAEVCDIPEEQIREVARLIAKAKSASVFEDLGTQQNIHSTLVSYLQRILWVICGHFAKEGAHNIAVPLISVTETTSAKSKSSDGAKKKRTSPVLGSRIITGLLPCSEFPDEVLTDHPDRFRAAFVQSSNPVHAYANTPRMREAFEALELSVVIDVAMTETARLADYVLPASSQFEKYECTFFSVEFPKNHMHLRHPIVEPLPGTLPEAEMIARLIDALEVVDPTDLAQLKGAMAQGRQALAFNLVGKMTQNPKLASLAPYLLYRTLGPTLEDGALAAAAPFWGLCHQFAQTKGKYAANAGYEGDPWTVGEALFEALITSPSGFIYTSSEDYEDTWNRVGYPDKRIRLHLDDLFPQVTELDASPIELPEGFDFVLSAGNRRATTNNVIIRDTSWDKKGNAAVLYMNPEDAAAGGIETGDQVILTTATGSAQAEVEVSEIERRGSISLPNGFGIDYRNHNGSRVKNGVAPNELTASETRDFFAGTPWHKFVPARVEKVAT